eukprot:757007-Hanusia_phi.AAC.4
MAKEHQESEGMQDLRHWKKWIETSINRYKEERENEERRRLGFRSRKDGTAARTYCRKCAIRGHVLKTGTEVD